MFLDRLDFQGKDLPLEPSCGWGFPGFRGFPVGSGCGLVKGVKEVKEGRKLFFFNVLYNEYIY